MIDVRRLDLEPLRQAAALAVVGVSAGGVRTTRSVGRVTPRSPFRIASVSKTLTAVAVVLASEDAGVGLDTPVLRVLPELRTDWAADADLTIANILSQTSGLAPTVTADDVAALGDEEGALLEAARLVVRAGSARPRGCGWEYYNGNYFLAGAVLGALAGTTYEQAMEKLVLRPLHLDDTSFAVPTDLVRGMNGDEPVPIAAYPRGRRPSGGFCSTAADLLTFGEQLLDQPDLLRTLGTVRTHAEDPTRYGLGWAIGPSGQMYLNGRLPGYRSAMMLVPAHDLVAVVLAANADGLPAAAQLLSDLQRGLTTDDLAGAIDTFAT